ncbi:MAG: hypothetical protein ACXWDO_02115 [Bacteroidia bacterium]
MADKIKKARSRYEEDEKYTDRDDDQEYDDEEFDGGGRNYSNRGGSGSKYEKLYGVIDALVDQIDMPRNRIRAIKFGIRALGELLSDSETKRRSNGGQRSKSSHSGERGSHAAAGERGVSRTHKGE